VSEPRQIIGWNVYGSTRPDAEPVAFIPAEDAPGMTLEAEIALYLQDQEGGPGVTADS
jgi:hypothetical protein